jgi:ketosteroid isomerase-like protein
MASPAVPDLTAAFEQLERAWSDAVIAQDRAALERILAPEYCLVVSAAPDRPVPRATWLDGATGYYRMRRSDNSAVAAHPISEDVVVVSFLHEQEATVSGVDRSMTFFNVDVWRRDADGWRVVVRHSALPEANTPSSRAATGG